LYRTGYSYQRWR